MDQESTSPENNLTQKALQEGLISQDVAYGRFPNQDEPEKIISFLSENLIDTKITGLLELIPPESMTRIENFSSTTSKGDNEGPGYPETAKEILGNIPCVGVEGEISNVLTELEKRAEQISTTLKEQYKDNEIISTWLEESVNKFLLVSMRNTAMQTLAMLYDIKRGFTQISSYENWFADVIDGRVKKFDSLLQDRMEERRRTAKRLTGIRAMPLIALQSVFEILTNAARYNLR